MSGAPWTICSVVEGHGEVSALPVLLRRLGDEVRQVPVLVPTPHRLPRGKMLKDFEISRAVRLQRDRAGGRGGVLVLLDADDDEPTALADRVGASLGIAAERGVEVVVAVREFEAWFLAAVELLRDHRSVLEGASLDGDAEAPRDAKGRLAKVMNESYRETIHQAAFCSRLDLGAAVGASPSFRSLVTAMERLVRG